MPSAQRKSEAINLRMSPAVKAMLREAAEREHRTLSNMLEVLILSHCAREGIEVPSSAAEAGRKTKGK
jgi:uncharacterized protein (DUF1778 family)